MTRIAKIVGGNSGKYFGKDPIHVIIGKPLYLRDMYDDNLSEKENVEKLNKILAKNTGKPLETIKLDTERDNFMSADEACEYGVIDKVITKKDI